MTRIEQEPARDAGGPLGSEADSPLPTLYVEAATGRVLSANAAASDIDIPRDLAAYRVAGDPEGSFAGRVSAGGPVAGLEVMCDSPTGPRAFLAYRSVVRGPKVDGVASISLVEVTQLRASEALLRRQIEARDEFVTVAAHELKDPLVALQLALRLTLEMAADGGPASDLVDYLEIARRQSERLGGLMENLLDLSRISGGRARIDREAVDLSALAWEVTSRMRATANLADSPLGVEAAVPVIGYLDRTKVDQILTNLLGNAVKYGAGRPVSVRVHAAGDRGVIEVEDGGRGIHSADQERIFERFERAADVRSRESLGLGLYIVKTYAEAHGGSVQVRSEVGRGSTFVVELPLRQLAGGSAGGESTLIAMEGEHGP